MKWVLYICSDCATDEGAMILPKPDDVNEEAGPGIVDHCPGCDSYLSLLHSGEVEVTGNALVLLRMREPA